jgi:hypothetical protein
MGTPSSITNTSTNSVTSTSHTHAITNGVFTNTTQTITGLKTFQSTIDTSYDGAIFGGGSPLGTVKLTAGAGGGSAKIIPTASSSDRVLTLPDNTGTIALLSDVTGDPDQNLFVSIITDSGTATAVAVDDTVDLLGGSGIVTSETGNVITIDLDLNELSTETVIQSNDFVVFWDVSGTPANKKITTANFFAGYSDSSILGTDEFVIVKSSTVYNVTGQDIITYTQANLLHDSFSDHDGNEHIDHTSVTITAGSGLSYSVGGTDISSSATIDLDINSLGTASIASGDFIAFWDITATATNKKTTFANFVATIDGDGLVDSSGVLDIGTTTNGGLNVSTDYVAIDFSDLVVETSIVAADSIAMVDDTDNGSGKITLANFLASIDGQGLVVNGSELELDISNLGTTDTTVGDSDILVIDDGATKKITFANFKTELNSDLNFISNQDNKWGTEFSAKTSLDDIDIFLLEDFGGTGEKKYITFTNLGKELVAGTNGLTSASGILSLDISELSSDTAVGDTDVLAIDDGATKKITFANFKSELIDDFQSEFIDHYRLTSVFSDEIGATGNQTLIAQSTYLVTAINTVATTITVKHKVFKNGDIIYLEDGANKEYMTVTSGYSANGSNWDYTVTRNTDGSGANSWSVDDVIYSLGKYDASVNDGFVEMYSGYGFEQNQFIGIFDYDESVNGSDLVTNGTFAAWTGDDPDNFTLVGTEVVDEIYINESSSRAHFYNEISGELYMYQDILKVGQKYRITFDLDSNTDLTGAYIRCGSSGTRTAITGGTGGKSYELDCIGDGRLIVGMDEDSNFIIDDLTCAVVGTFGTNHNRSEAWTIFTAIPAVGDCVYFGKKDQFRQITWVLSQAGVYGVTFVWEFWNGSAWTSFTPTTFDDWKAAGDGECEFSAVTLTDWAACYAGSIYGWWVRVRLSAISSMTTPPITQALTISDDYFSGTTIAGYTRGSSTYDDKDNAFALGNLRGHYGYATDIFGAGLGVDSEGSMIMTIEDTNDFRLRTKTGDLYSDVWAVDTTGKLTILDDVTLYRQEANHLRTDDVFSINQGGTSYSYGLRLYSSTNYWAMVQGSDNRFFFGYNSASRVVFNDAIGKTSIELPNGTDVGITFGTDANAVNLYKSATNVLKTDDNLEVASSIYNEDIVYPDITVTHTSDSLVLIDVDIKKLDDTVPTQPYWTVHWWFSRWGGTSGAVNPVAIAGTQVITLEDSTSNLVPSANAPSTIANDATVREGLAVTVGSNRRYSFKVTNSHTGGDTIYYFWCEVQGRVYNTASINFDTTG